MRVRSVSGWLIVAMIAGQLAILEVKQLREEGSALVHGHAFFDYAPNLLAALTLPCFFLAMSLKGRSAGEPYRWPWLWRENVAILRALLLTLGGLLGWEFIQVYRPNRTFDWQDVWATLVGGLLFLLVVLVARIATAGGSIDNPAHVAASPLPGPTSKDAVP
ncbi:VanZ family protein [Lysobacter niabensis]|uniref:VanZ family protein n=1 Tax=Agrilutibacter niabensis TaxID=380628 RepID=UPI00361FC8B2